MNTMQANESHDIAHGSDPHPGLFPTVNYYGSANPGTGGPGTGDPGTSGDAGGSGTGTDHGGTGIRQTRGGTGGGGTDTGGSGSGGSGGTGTGGTGTGGTGTGGTGTSGTGTGGTGTGGTGTSGSGGSGTGGSQTAGVGGTGVRMVATRLATLKSKRKIQFRTMRDRVEAGARSLIDNVQEFIRLTSAIELIADAPTTMRSLSEHHVSAVVWQNNSHAADTLEFDGLGIS